jgi:hypothetical protein
MGLIISIIVFGIIFYLLKNTSNLIGKIFVFIIIAIVLAVFMAMAKG